MHSVVVAMSVSMQEKKRERELPSDNSRREDVKKKEFTTANPAPYDNPQYPYIHPPSSGSASHPPPSTPPTHPSLPLLPLLLATIIYVSTNTPLHYASTPPESQIANSTHSPSSESIVLLVDIRAYIPTMLGANFYFVSDRDFLLDVGRFSLELRMSMNTKMMKKKKK